MVSSLGVHKHWNNPIDKQYSRDLNKDGTGIDLVSIPDSLVKHIYAEQVLFASQSNFIKAYPNPFNSVVYFSYTVPENGRVCISIYNLKGQSIAKLIDEKQNQGNYIQKWVPSLSLPSGIYFAKISVDNNYMQSLRLIK